MNFEIKHTTEYRYTEQVFLEPHFIRLTPRADHHVTVKSHHLSIDPEPAGMSPILENDGTQTNFTWFQEMTGHLMITSGLEVSVKAYNPFDFLIHPSSGLRLPMMYSQQLINTLGPYISNEESMSEVKVFSNDIARKCNLETVSFLIELCRSIHEDFEYEMRHEGQAHPPADTLLAKHGACRDFAVLAMAVCRLQNIACRYVSGYYLSESEDEPGDLHAWFEVYLPGVGWKGFDPSHGIMCDHHHLALSASANPALTMPVSGSFRGNSTCRMKSEVFIAKKTAKTAPAN